MDYGCIGEKLGHSFSKEIHERINERTYELKEISYDALKPFMESRKFKAINVTIPYKQEVMQYIDVISENAKKIGAVNTVVNRNGVLYGFNTDYAGLKTMIIRAGIEIAGKKVLILGTGGTSLTANAVVTSMGAREIVRVSRFKSENVVTYEEVYFLHSDAEVIINTTPVGMYPNNYFAPIDVTMFRNLTGVVDVVYNPLRTKLICEANAQGIKATGGLFMLIAQAVHAEERFDDITIDPEVCEKVYREISLEKMDIVLTGMPRSGKSTIGKILAKKMGKVFYDTDELIEEEIGMKIPEFFEKYGEYRFRNIETAIVKRLSAKGNCVISTGGGAILRSENVQALSMNGKLIFLNRPLADLMPSADRPLANTKEKIVKLYEKRLPVYKKCCDLEIGVTGTPEECAERIMKCLI